MTPADGVLPGVAALAGDGDRPIRPATDFFDGFGFCFSQWASSGRLGVKVQMWSVDRVVPYQRNPRRNDDAVEKVAASMKEFGFKQPIAMDKDAVIIVGTTGYSPRPGSA